MHAFFPLRLPPSRLEKEIFEENTARQEPVTKNTSALSMINFLRMGAIA
jgi:hypothetical protein